MPNETNPKKSSAIWIIIAILVIAGAVVIYFTIGNKEDKTNTNTTTNTNTNTNTVVTEAPFSRSGSTKIFDLKLVNGRLNYKTMTFYTGDTIQINLTDDAGPVDFEFQNVGAKSTSGVFSTSISNTDPGGVYQLICSDRSCGAITVTVINTNTNLNTNTSVNTNQNTNTNSDSTVTKAELQRLPAGTTFTPGMTMTTATNFTVGDQFGLNVIGVFNSGDKLTHSITDPTGTVITGEGPSSNLITGSNGSCCFSVPSTTGQYNVVIYVNGVESATVPMTVTE